MFIADDLRSNSLNNKPNTNNIYSYYTYSIIYYYYIYLII